LTYRWISKHVIQALESDTDIGALYQGSKLTHSVEHNFVFGGSHFGGGSSNYDTQHSNVGMQKLEKIAFNNQKLGSDYATCILGEYDANLSSTEMKSNLNSGEGFIGVRKEGYVTIWLAMR